MPKEVLMPRIDPGMKSGKLVKWLKKVGDQVKEGEARLVNEYRRLVREELAGVLVESWQNRFRLVDMAFHPAEGLSPEEAVERARRALEPRGFEVQYSGWAIHVHRRGVDKGAGLVEACKMLGLDPRQAIAVGDSEVDRPMLEAAGLAVAVGNAPRELREAADIVTREGYYRGFLEALQLLEEGGYI